LKRFFRNEIIVKSENFTFETLFFTEIKMPKNDDEEDKKFIQRKFEDIVMSLNNIIDPDSNSSRENLCNLCTHLLLAVCYCSIYHGGLTYNTFSVTNISLVKGKVGIEIKEGQTNEHTWIKLHFTEDGNF
jgi:hypothetical protein